MSSIDITDGWFIEKRFKSSFPLNRRSQIKEDGEAHVWLEEDLCFILQFSDGSRKKYRIKKGYHFDGASIPKVFQWLIGPALGGSYEGPACAHDILCESKEMRSWLAGAAFNVLMDSVGVASWRRAVMWRAVRRFCQVIQNRYPEKIVMFARDHLEVEVT